MWYTITSDREVKDHDAGIQGHKTSSDAGIGGLDPRGSRQMDMKTCPPGSLPAGINNII